MLELDIDGIKFEFGIEDYRPSTREHWDDEWCVVTARATSDALNYSIRSSCMVCCEVEWLYKKLVELEDGTLTDETEISNIEPDFEYTLYPSENGQYYMDWKFNLWNGGVLTCNSFTIMFGEEDIMKLREYLNDVMSK